MFQSIPERQTMLFQTALNPRHYWNWNFFRCAAHIVRRFAGNYNPNQFIDPITGDDPIPASSIRCRRPGVAGSVAGEPWLSSKVFVPGSFSPKANGQGLFRSLFKGLAKSQRLMAKG